MTTFLVTLNYQAEDGSYRKRGDILELDEDRSTERDSSTGHLRKANLNAGFFRVVRAYREGGTYGAPELTHAPNAVVFLAGEEIIDLERGGFVVRLDLRDLLGKAKG